MSTPDQRSEREASENHLAKLLQESFLTEKVPYNKFQTFLDFKDDATFSSFRRKLESCVEREDCKWSELESDPKKRFSLATRFLTKVGDEYWGNNTEKREKYLTKSDDPDDNCRWPDHREPIIQAVIILLKKISRQKTKPKRESTINQSASNTGSESQSSQPSRQQVQRVQATPTKQAIKPPLPPLPSRASQPPLSPTTQHVQHTTMQPRAQSAESITPTQIKRDVSTSPNKIRMLPISFPVLPSTEDDSSNGRKQASRKPAAASSSTTSGHLQTEHTQRRHVQEKPVKISFPDNPGSHEQRTYFLIRDEHYPMEARSMGWRMFETSTELIDRMEREVSDLGDPSAWQIQNDTNNPRYYRYAYAVVYLEWSKVTFVIRRGRTRDLQELLRHVGCAWHADDGGKISTAEFRIEVTLKKEEAGGET